jgi:DNA mismatch repair protein MutS2
MHFASSTLAALGWTRIQQALSARARTEPGQARALQRPFLDDREAVLEALALVEEARELRNEPLKLPLGGLTEIRPLLERAARGGLLEPRELTTVTHALFALERTGDTLHERKDKLPRLHGIAHELPEVDRLATRLDRALEPSGELSDRASPELKAARDRVRGLHSSIKARLDALLADQGFAVNLRESYYSVRNERYVVPVKSQEQRLVPGIVHNASHTGQTLFVEPDELIAQGNELAIAQSLVLEEERRVLLELSGAVGAQAQDLARGIEACAKLDELEAAADLAEALDATAPELQPAGGALVLKGLRHPRLLLGGTKVVANDVELLPPARGLVVSGPNSGGKTVTLTGVGLCALMVRSGLPVPVDPGSRLPLFDSVHAAVGDAQDLSAGLSTFTAHVTQLREVLESSGPGALVLVDEIAADTDPREGAALAIAVLEEFIARGALVLVTTHLEELKALAHLDQRFLNARVGFDSRAMAPTYRLQLGAAGASSAIDIARRVGLATAVCDRASSLAQDAGGALAKALAAAEAERRTWEEAKDKNRLEAERLAVERAAMDEERKALDLRRTQAELKFREALEGELAYAREQVQKLLVALEAERDLKKTKAAAGELFTRLQEQTQAIAQARAAITGGPPPSGEKLVLAPGRRAHHPGLNADVEILEINGGEALVAAGLLKTRVPVAELQPPKKGSTKSQFPGGASDQRGREQRAAAAAPGAPALGGPSCDVRGMRAEDAIRAVDQSLDAATRDGHETLLIIHGHGTGALKASVRNHLTSSGYVASHRSGEQGEGGDGATIAVLR